jgi:hypothetical protein
MSMRVKWKGACNIQTEDDKIDNTYLEYLKRNATFGQQSVYDSIIKKQFMLGILFLTVEIEILFHVIHLSIDGTYCLHIQFGRWVEQARR